MRLQRNTSHQWRNVSLTPSITPEELFLFPAGDAGAANRQVDDFGDGEHSHDNRNQSPGGPINKDSPNV